MTDTATDTEEVNKGGAPTLYTDEAIKVLEDLFFPYIDHDYNEDQSNHGYGTNVKIVRGSRGGVHKVMPKELPTMMKAAWKLGVSTKTLQRWSEAVDDEGNLLHEEFCLTYERCMDIQKFYLQDTSYRGLGDTKMGIFLLKNNHDMVDKTEQALDVSEGLLARMSKAADAAEKEQSTSQE